LIIVYGIQIPFFILVTWRGIGLSAHIVCLSLLAIAFETLHASGKYSIYYYLRYVFTWVRKCTRLLISTISSKGYSVLQQVTYIVNVVISRQCQNW